MIVQHKNPESIFMTKRRSTIVREKKDIIQASPFVPPHLRLFQAISVGRDTTALLDNDLSEGPIIDEVSSPASPNKLKNKNTHMSDNSPERKSLTTEDESDNVLVEPPSFLPALFDILEFNDEEFIASKDQ